MDTNREVLIIGTYGIDVFHGAVEALEQHGCRTFTASDQTIAKEYLQNREFDAIIINLEPDGKGGVAEITLLKYIAQSSLQQNAVCLGVSLQYPHTLPGSKADRHLDILAGWLTLPIKASSLADHIVELVASADRITVKKALSAQNKTAD